MEAAFLPADMPDLQEAPEEVEDRGQATVDELLETHLQMFISLSY